MHNKDSQSSDKCVDFGERYSQGWSLYLDTESTEKILLLWVPHYLKPADPRFMTLCTDW